MRELKQALLAEYGSFADKRIKNIDTGHLFIVDDREGGDVGYLWFCMVFADVQDANTVKVSLAQGVPYGPSVDEWCRKTGVAAGKKAIEFTVTSATLERLTSLGNALQQIVRPGARYEEAAFKYVCPRTARSLERLASTLARAWN